MKLVFIENRHKTYFYLPIAEQLQKEEHDIHWLVQNKEFTPKTSANIEIISYPKSEREILQKDNDIEEIIKSDRQFNHFGTNNLNHFYYYYDEIERILDKINPDMIFGESTAFHELLVILYAKRRDILFLHPSSCRYPVGRFSFYQYDTLIPYKGSGKNLDNTTALTIIDQIVHRSAAPDYMRLVPPSKITQLQDKILKIKSYANGEKFNTPNPRTKFRVEKEQKKRITEWDQLSLTNIDEVEGYCILYPLQMQPEANIDVWGKQFRDQKELIKELSENLPDGVKLIVKPNPKSKYEISQELLDLIDRSNDIIPLHHQVKMEDVFGKVDAVITVTGTIAIECILSDKPVITLVHTLNNQVRTCIHLSSIQKELRSTLDSFQSEAHEKLSKEEKIHFINLLNSTSFDGKVSDPLTDISCISEANVEKMVSAFRDIINAE